MNPMLNIRIDSEGHLAVAGELDLCTAPYLRDAIDWAVARCDGDLSVDLGAVSFMDLSGLRALAAAARELTRGHLVLLAPSPAVQRLIDLLWTDLLPAIRVIPAAPNHVRREVRPTIPRRAG